MNAEVIKAMNKKETKIGTVRKWWNKNGYKVSPVWLVFKVKRKITSYLNSREVWSEERAKKILNYYVPRYARWNAKEKGFYFFDNGMGWSMDYAKKHLKRKDRRFWKVYSSWCGGKIRSYLINEFELEGFEKEVGDCSSWKTDIFFKMIEK